MKYERLTERMSDGKGNPNCSECEHNKMCGDEYYCDDGESCYQAIFDRLAEFEDKIENGDIIYPKYPIYFDVYIIDYVDEKGFSVYNGKPVVRKCFVTSITQMTRTATSVIYRVQPHELPREVLDGNIDVEFWERGLYERDLFASREEAEKRLKEMQG
jgi:hypothetical protein